MTQIIEYKAIRYPHPMPTRTLEDIEQHILTTRNKVVTTEAVRRVLNARISRVKELEEQIRILKLERAVGEARRLKSGVAK